MIGSKARASLWTGRTAAGILLIAAAVAFQAVELAPETQISRVSLNDSVFHLAATERLEQSIVAHEPFLDPWVSEWSLGYPIWRSYQPLPHLLAAGFLWLLHPFLDHAAAFAALQYLLLVLLPLSAAFAARMLGFGPVGSGVAALLILAPSGSGELGAFGLEYGAFVWRGSGLYTQLLALHLLLLFLATISRSLDTGRCRYAAAILLAATSLSHIVFGYVAFVSAALFMLVGPAGERKARFARLVSIVLPALLLLAWFIVPFFLSRGEINHSRWEAVYKWDSFGAARILGSLVSGVLLDAGRLPLLTLLVAAAAATAVIHRREPTARRLLALTLLWLALFFGRPTWGGLLRLLAVPADFPLHRLQAAFEVSAVLLVAWAAQAWLGRAGTGKPIRLAVGAALLLVALGGILAERARYLRENAAWGRENLQSYALERAEIERALASAREILASRPGRVSAGKAADWGNRFKVGYVPFYNFVSREHLDETSFLYHAMSKTSDVMVLRDEESSAHDAAFGIRAVIAPADWKPPAFLRLRGLFGRFSVYEASPEGYFGLADIAARAPDDAETEFAASSSWLSSPWVEQGLVVALGGREELPIFSAGGALPSAPAALLAPRGRIVSESKEGESYRATIEALRPCSVVLKVTYDPHLAAELDGRPVGTSKVTPGFVALPLPAGRHRIEVRYRPGPLRPILFFGGLLISMALSKRLRRLGAFTSSIAPSDTSSPTTGAGDALSGPSNKSSETLDDTAAAQNRGLSSFAGSPPARVAQATFLVLLAFYLAVNRGHFQSSDEITVYQTTQSLWEKGDLSTNPKLPNAKAGVGGKSYGVYSVGQSIAALPLYGLGKAVDRLLVAGGLTGVRKALSGDSIELSRDYRWGGDVQIFFVAMFNAFVTALLCAVFFAFNLRLGVSPRWSLAATLLLGAASYLAVQATTFFQHSSEALFALLAAYFLYEDSLRPGWRARAAAGLSAGLLLLFRFQGIVALPALFFYLAWNSFRRSASGEATRLAVRRIARESVPFVAPVAVAAIIHVWSNVIKFGSATLTGAYGEQVAWFHNPLLRGLYGLLLSPGEGLLLFCPLLLLLPWTMRHFFRGHAPEAALVTGLALSYLLLIARYDLWHGQWCFGPRYLTTLVPLLFLPLGGWMQNRGRRVWKVVAPLASLGAAVAALGVAVNFSYVYYAEGYFREQPRYPFLFIARRSQLLSHARALFAMDGRVDLWLLSVLRGAGFLPFLLAALPAGLLFSFGVRRLRRSLAECPEVLEDARSLRLLPGTRSLAAAGSAVVLFCVAGLSLARMAPRDDAGQLMKAGMAALYERRAPEEAIDDFRRVLAMNPKHYGATFQLARALDAAGKPDQARPLWIKMFSMSANDPPTLAIVKERLSQPRQPVTDESRMREGLDLLYTKHDPKAAAEIFRKVLESNPEHYGATYQIAVALDQIGQGAEARGYWERVLRMAEGYRDETTLAKAKSRLAR